MHQENGDAIDALAAQPDELVTRGLAVEFGDDRAVGVDPLVDLDHVGIEHGRQDDRAGRSRGGQLGC